MKVDLLQIEKLDESLQELTKEEMLECLRGILSIVREDYEELNMEIENTPFERIRRITGYLVGTTDRFNDAKKDELKHRVKHSISVNFNEEINE